MRKGIIITSLILSALLIMDSMNVSHAIMMFIIAGNIPGTTLYLDASTTLWVCMGLVGFIASRFTTRMFTIIAIRSLKISHQRV